MHRHSLVVVQRSHGKLPDESDNSDASIKVLKLTFLSDIVQIKSF